MTEIVDVESLDFEPVLAPIAAEYQRRYRRYGVDAEDLRQEMRLWVYQHPDKINEWAESEDGADKPVGVTLRNLAKKVCEQYKAQHLGYSYDDVVWYSRNELKHLLDAVFDQESWNEPPVSEDGGRARRDPATGGNWVAMLADVAQAFAKLTRGDQHMLRAFHDDGMTNQMLADLYDVTPQAMSNRHTKALNRLLKIMGGEKPKDVHDGSCECEPQYVGTRNVVSNAAARAMTDSNYQET